MNLSIHKLKSNLIAYFLILSKFAASFLLFLYLSIHLAFYTIESIVNSSQLGKEINRSEKRLIDLGIEKLFLYLEGTLCLILFIPPIRKFLIL